MDDNYESEEKVTEDTEDTEDSEDNLEEIENDRNISKPIASVRNGPGSYELKNNFGKKQKQNTDVSRHVKKSTQNSDKEDGNTLMAAAMAMQKEREVESSKTNSVNQRPI